MLQSVQQLLQSVSPGENCKSMERGCQRYTHVKPAISVSGPRYAEEERERVREGKDGEEGERTCEIDINAEKNSEW